MFLPREKPLPGLEYFSLFGTFAVALTCDRTPGEPGIFPLDAQVNLPERCNPSFLQECMTRWSMEGAEAILALRSLTKSHDSDLRDYWRFRACQVRTRHYACKPKYWATTRLRGVA